MPYCAAQVSELFSRWQVFSVHLNWSGFGHAQQYHLCLLLADRQANLLCASAESGRLFLHVLLSMGDQGKIIFLTVVCWCVTLDDSCVDVSPFQSYF